MKDKEIIDKVVKKLVKENVMLKIPTTVIFKKKDKTNFPVQATKIISLDYLLRKAIRQAFKLKRDTEKRCIYCKGKLGPLIFGFLGKMSKEIFCSEECRDKFKKQKSKT